MSFKVSKEELKTYREEHGLGITAALDKIRKLKMITYLEEGGTAEPVLLALLKDWAADSKALVKVETDEPIRPSTESEENEVQDSNL